MIKSHEKVVNMIKLSRILLGCFFLNSYLLVSMNKGTPEEEKAKIEKMAIKSVAEKKSPWLRYCADYYKNNQSSVQNKLSHRTHNQGTN